MPPSNNEESLQSSRSLVRVLLAEDYPLARLALKIALKRIPWVVLLDEAADGKEAIEKAGKLKPDLIIMDVGLPALDGINAVSAIKSQLPSCYVVMFTSRSESIDVIAAIAAGADGYCLKDTNLDKLETAIKGAVRGCIWLDPDLSVTTLQAVSGICGHEAARKLVEFCFAGMRRQEIAERLSLNQEEMKLAMQEFLVELKKGK